MRIDWRRRCGKICIAVRHKRACAFAAVRDDLTVSGETASRKDQQGTAAMDRLRINGGVPLKGEINISGAKNAALPLLALGLMSDDAVVLENVPRLADTLSMEGLIRHHGVDVVRKDNTVTLSGAASSFDAPYYLVRKMRASILVLGPLLARYGNARVSLPGGCAIGTRPVDLHIRSMQALGAIVELADGYIQARAPQGLSGGRVCFQWCQLARRRML